MTRLSGYGTVDPEHAFTHFMITPRWLTVWCGIQVATALPAEAQIKQSKYGTRIPSSYCNTIPLTWEQLIRWPFIPGELFNFYEIGLTILTSLQWQLLAKRKR